MQSDRSDVIIGPLVARSDIVVGFAEAHENWILLTYDISVAPASFIAWTVHVHSHISSACALNLYSTRTLSVYAYSELSYFIRSMFSVASKDHPLKFPVMKLNGTQRDGYRPADW